MVVAVAAEATGSQRGQGGVHRDGWNVHESPWWLSWLLHSQSARRSLWTHQLQRGRGCQVSGALLLRFFTFIYHYYCYHYCTAAMLSSHLYTTTTSTTTALLLQLHLLLPHHYYFTTKRKRKNNNRITTALWMGNIVWFLCCWESSVVQVKIVWGNKGQALTVW